MIEDSRDEISRHCINMCWRIHSDQCDTRKWWIHQAVVFIHSLLSLSLVSVFLTQKPSFLWDFILVLGDRQSFPVAFNLPLQSRLLSFCHGLVWRSRYFLLSNCLEAENVHFCTRQETNENCLDQISWRREGQTRLRKEARKSSVRKQGSLLTNYV